MNWRTGHDRRGHVTREYNTWRAMKYRCLNENDSFHWPLYGGRGITICERWKHFKNFLEDMGLRPEGMTIHRIESDVGYEPGNCRWATQKEQCSNRRRRVAE